MNTIHRLKKSQINNAAKTLSMAFKNDPLLILYFPDTSKRDQQIYRLYKYCIQDCKNVYTTSPKLEGIALYHLRNPLEKKHIDIIGKWNFFKLRLALKKTALEKVISIYDYTDSIHNELMPFPHCYFFILGIKPKFQKRGFGSKLIAHILTLTDKEKLPCYLDTNIKENKTLYERFGFNVVKRYQIPNTDVINWSMIRENPK